MKCFDPTHVPAITTLASEFALFDQLRICGVCMCVPHFVSSPSLTQTNTHTKRCWAQVALCRARTD